MPRTDKAATAAYHREYYLRPGRKEKIMAANKARRAVRRERIRAIKIERGCARCGFRECAQALEYHHREGEEKLFNIGTGTLEGIAWSRIEAEIAKCDVLCANCHRSKRCSCC